MDHFMGGSFDESHLIQRPPRPGMVHAEIMGAVPVVDAMVLGLGSGLAQAGSPGGHMVGGGLRGHGGWGFRLGGGWGFGGVVASRWTVSCRKGHSGTWQRWRLLARGSPCSCRVLLHAFSSEYVKMPFSVLISY